MTLRLPLPSGRIAARVDDPLDELLADPALSAALPTALHEHKVRVLPGANPTEEHHVALGALFGEPEVPQPQHPRHPERDTICVFDRDGGDKADRWHADETFTDNPCSGAVLGIVYATSRERQAAFAVRHEEIAALIADQVVPPEAARCR